MQKADSPVAARALFALILLLVPLGLCACSNTATSSDMTFQGNRIEMTVRSPASRVCLAARETLLEQKAAIVAYTVTEADGRIVAYPRSGRRLELVVRRVDDVSSRFTAATDGSSQANDEAGSLMRTIASRAR